MLELISGLLLTLVVVGGIVYVVREMLSDRGPEIEKARQGLADTLSKYASNDAKPVNEHLIGTTGKVVSLTGDDARPMKVRLGPELWSARMRDAGDDPLPVGAEITVTAVEGAVVVVEASPEPDVDALEHTVPMPVVPGDR